MKLNMFQRIVLLALAIILPEGTSATRKLTRKLYSFAKNGEIKGNQDELWSWIEE